MCSDLYSIFVCDSNPELCHRVAISPNFVSRKICLDVFCFLSVSVLHVDTPPGTPHVVIVQLVSPTGIEKIKVYLHPHCLLGVCIDIMRDPVQLSMEFLSSIVE